MRDAKVGSRLAQAGAVVAVSLCSFGTAWAIGGTIGGTYQDQVNLTVGDKNRALLLFKFNNDAALVVETVTCQIQSATPPPFEVSLSQSNPAGVLIFLPVTFVGATATKNVYSVFATELDYGVSKGQRPEIDLRWGSNGTYNVICSLVGRK